MIVGILSDLPEDDVFQIHVGAGGERDGEPAAICVLLADAGEQSGPLVEQLEGLVSKLGAIDGAVALS